MKQLYTNNANALLQNSISPSDTTINIDPAEASKFPSPNVGNGEYFLVTLENHTGTLQEIVKISARTGGALSVATGGRGQEGTSALTWNLPTLVDIRDTAATIKRLQRIFNTNYTIDIDGSSITRIITTIPFEAQTTQLFIGGLRQAINVDYIEENDTTIKLLFQLSLVQIGNGQNIVLDFSRK